jgi:hypothetical protein
MARYSAKLLFQYFVDRKKTNLFEERIVCFSAASDERAILVAKQSGSAAVFSSVNDEGQQVRFTFVGIRDLRHLGIECEENEVWYDVFELAEPLPRRSELVRSEASLLKKTKAHRARRK